MNEDYHEIPDDYLVRLWDDLKNAETAEQVETYKEKFRIELVNVMAILNYCEENRIPYIIDRIKVLKEIDSLMRYPKDPFVTVNEEVLLSIGYAIKEPCKRIFTDGKQVLAKSLTEICFHPIFGRYTWMINKIAYLPGMAKKKTDYKKLEQDIDLNF